MMMMTQVNKDDFIHQLLHGLMCITERKRPGRELIEHSPWGSEGSLTFGPLI